MDSDFIYYEEHEGIGYIFFNRIEKLNALDSQMLRLLNDLLYKIDVSQIKCLIFKSNSEKAFIAGADVNEMALFSPDQAYDYSQFGKKVFKLIEDLPIPTISLIRGYALGGGCELALSCDFRMCDENAKFGFPEVGLGILPGFGGTVRLPLLIGPSNAKYLIFSGIIIDSNEALRMNLVNQVLNSNDFDKKVDIFVKRVILNAPISIRSTKNIIKDQDCTQLFIEESNKFAACFSTNDCKIGLNAFLKKEKPVFINE